MRSCALSLLGAFRRVAIPLGAYYAVTLLIPIANGAVSAAFLKHAAVVVAVPLVLIAATHILTWVTHALARRFAVSRFGPPHIRPRPEWFST